MCPQPRQFRIPADMCPGQAVDHGSLRGPHGAAPPWRETAGIAFAMTADRSRPTSSASSSALEKFLTGYPDAFTAALSSASRRRASGSVDSNFARSGPGG